MDAKQVIKGITVLMLAGAALGAAYAESAATEPAAEEAKVQASAPDPAAIPVKATDEAAGQEADHDVPTAADTGDKPYSIQRALSGAADLFERAKNFVMPSGK